MRADRREAKKKVRGWSYLNSDPNVISTNPLPIVSPQLNKEKLQLFPQVTRQAHSEVLFNYGATLFNSTRLLSGNDESTKLLARFAVMSSPTFCAETASSFPRGSFRILSVCLSFHLFLFGYVTAPRTFRIQICLLSYLRSESACMCFTKCKQTVFHLSLTMHASRVK